MRTPATPILFALTLFLFFIGVLFKIMHWSFGEFLIVLSLLSNAGFIFAMMWEIVSSKNVNVSVKRIWAIAYFLILITSVYLCLSHSIAVLLLLPVVVITGLLHLTIARKKFAPKEREIDKIKFDSF